MAGGYVEWDAKPEAAPTSHDAGYEEYRPPTEPARDWTDLAAGAAKTTGYGAVAGLGAYAVRGLLRRAFPGMMPKTSAFRRLDDAIKSADSSSGLKPMMSRYVREAAETNKKMTFADFLANQPGHSTAQSVVKEMVANSGNVPAIESKLADRAADAKSRVLKDIASGLGVKPETITSGIERLKLQKEKTAEPLYAEAFKDKAPIRDTKLLDLFGTDTPNMAMMNALRERLKTLSLRGEEPPSLLAADPKRKDAWKRLLTSEVPEQMFSGDEWRGLRQYYAPSIEDLHHMRRNLWALREQAKKGSDGPKAEAYLNAWRGLTDYLDTRTSGAYKKARDAYKGDSDLEAAHEYGTELLHPDTRAHDVRAKVGKMSGAEREALAQGFYGAVNDMQQQRLSREIVGRPERYPERREVLSAVFRDPVKLDQFMKNLEGEEAMSDSFSAFGNPPPSRDAHPRMPWMRLSDQLLQPGGGGASARIVANISPHTGWPSGRASRAGTDFLFRDPQLFGYGATHPDWNAVNATPMSGLERAKNAGKFTGSGAMGGLGLYGASQLPEYGGEQEFQQ